MKKYGRFVRNFGEGRDSQNSTPTDAGVWKALRLAFGDTVLFPNIRYMYLNDIHILRSITLFSTQNLTYATPSPRISSMLPEFSTLCPNLESIYFVSGWNEAKEQDAISALSNWPKITQFTSYRMSSGLLNALSQHSRLLETLKFNEFDPGTSQWPPPLMDGNTPLFPALEEIEIAFDSYPNFLEFLKCFPLSHHLEEFTVKVDDPYLDLELSIEETWLALLRSLKTSSHSLQQLIFGDTEGDWKDLYPYMDSFELPPQMPGSQILATLATNFKILTRLEISNKGGFDVSDEDLKILTEALPLLEIFHLYDGSKITRTSYNTTISSLLYFAQNCPSIRYLGLEFDARKDKLSQPSSKYSPQARELRYLNVATSLVDNTRLVADILYLIFPRLEGIESKWREDPEGFRHSCSLDCEDGVDGHSWSDVMQRIKAHRRQRRLPPEWIITHP